MSFLENEIQDRFNSITIIYRNDPLPVSENMVKTIEYIFEKYDCAVFLEDDISVSANFLNFMNGALDYYKADKEVFAVCGNNMISVQGKYETDVFACDMFKSHGYALWKEKYYTFKREFDASMMYKVKPSVFYEGYHFLYEVYALYVLGKGLFDFDLFSEYKSSIDIDAVFLTWHLDDDEIIDKLRSEGCDKPIIFAVPFMMDFLYESDKLNKRFKQMTLR